MIHVQEKLEPTDFNAKVRVPGNAFLATLSHQPTNKDFKKHKYWSKALSDLYSAYGGICAYSASWIAPEQSQPTVDHYLSKDKAPNSAYEWKNYRLSNPKMNNNKANFDDVLDPFIVQNGWFELSFASFLINPAKNLTISIRKSVNDTIDRLKLNDDDSLVQSRANIVEDYAKGHISFDYLNRKYPFIGFELTRQNLIVGIKAIIK